MDMILGPAFLGGAMVLFAWAYVTFRRPDAGRWTTNEFVAQLVTVSIAALLALGIGFTSTAVAFGENESFSIAALAGGIVLLAAGVLACRWSFAQVRRLEAAARAPSNPLNPTKPIGPAANQSRRWRKAA